MTKYEKSLPEIWESFQVLGDEINNINASNGWPLSNTDSWPKQSDSPEIIADKVAFLSTKLLLIHAEVSEAAEAIRELDENNFQEELADVIIRVIDLAHGMRIDLSGEIARKLDINRERGYRHGGKTI